MSAVHTTHTIIFGGLFRIWRNATSCLDEVWGIARLDKMPSKSVEQFVFVNEIQLIVKRKFV